MILCIICLLFCASVVQAQHHHSDVEFAYESGRIQIEWPEDGPVFESDFPLSGISKYLTTLPGFASELDEGGGIGVGDEVFYDVLSDLTYWDGVEVKKPDAAIEIHIRNNPGSVPNTVVGVSTGEQFADLDVPTNRISGASAAGEVHSDLQWFLETTDPDVTPALGIYGLQLRLTTSNASIEPSDPFYFLFNLGLEETLFEEGVEVFSNLMAGLPGDFDGNGLLDAVDIDALSDQVRAITHAALYDLNDDGLVDDADRDFWVGDLRGTRFGDVDLNGSVDFADFLVLSANFGGEGGWSDGDFTGDGMVAFPDFLSLSVNFGQVAAVAVPEPSSRLLGLCFLVPVVLFRRASFQ